MLEVPLPALSTETSTSCPKQAQTYLEHGEKGIEEGIEIWELV